jgi:hypothetical protein
MDLLYSQGWWLNDRGRSVATTGVVSISCVCVCECECACVFTQLVNVFVECMRTKSGSDGCIRSWSVCQQPLQSIPIDPHRLGMFRSMRAPIGLVPSVSKAQVHRGFVHVWKFHHRYWHRVWVALLSLGSVGRRQRSDRHCAILSTLIDRSSVVLCC